MPSYVKTANFSTLGTTPTTGYVTNYDAVFDFSEIGWIVDGTEGADKLYGSQLADGIYGYGGNDTLYGQDGDDEIFGGEGKDLLLGGRGADYLDGGAGNDTASYAGSASGVTINLATGLGYGGDAQGDTLVSIENVIGSSYSDTLVGDALNNKLSGGGGDDLMLGGAGQDSLLGGNGNDTIYGGSGRDTISGGSGNDVLRGDDAGGKAMDVFVFNNGESGADTVLDFQRGTDWISLRGFGADAFGRDGQMAIGSFGNSGEFFGLTDELDWHGIGLDGGDKVMFLTDTKQLVRIDSLTRVDDNWSIEATLIATFNDIPKINDFIVG